MNSPIRPSSRRSVVAAVVLGTALSALGSSTAYAVTSEKAVTDISRYCTTCWRNARLHPDFWVDCTQDVFARLMERLNPAAWDRVMLAEGEERREFLRAIDAVKKRTQRSRKWVSLPEDSLADLRNGHTRDARAAVEHAAADLLSGRQQKILRLSFEGWSVHEIAEEMQIPAERISDEKYKAIRKLREKLSEN